MKRILLAGAIALAMRSLIVAQQNRQMRQATKKTFRDTCNSRTPGNGGKDDGRNVQADADDPNSI